VNRGNGPENGSRPRTPATPQHVKRVHQGCCARLGNTKHEVEVPEMPRGHAIRERTLDEGVRSGKDSRGSRHRGAVADNRSRGACEAGR